MCLMHAQLCLTFCNPVECSLPGSSVHRIFPTRMLEWVAIFSSGDLLYPGMEFTLPALQVDSLSLNPTGK